jgi:hypothetical protein
MNWTDGRAVCLILIGLLLQAHAQAQSADTYDVEIDLNWIPPTTNVDGTPLTDLNGYRIYWGWTGSGIYDGPTSPVSILPGGSSYTLDVYGVPVENTGIWVAMTAIDSENPPNESDFSNEVSFGPFGVGVQTQPNSGSGLSGTARIVRCPPGYNCVL